MSLNLPDPTRCPLCGEANNCAMANRGDAAGGEANGGAPGCWCERVQFSRELLERIPEEARNRACICAACAAGNGGT